MEIGCIVRQKVSGARLAECPTDQRRQRIRTQIPKAAGRMYALRITHRSSVRSMLLVRDALP